MCGLIGYIGLGKKENLAKRLLIAGQRRGTHATGYIEITRDDGFILSKKAISAKDFTEKFSLTSKAVTFLGHTRYATCGDPTNSRQAHPFNAQRYALMHNGWLSQTDWRMLERRFGIRSPNGVDSEMFLSFVEKYGSIDILRDEMLPLVSDSSRYMLIIYDKLAKRLHFMKDNQQDFCFTKLDQGGIIYASTESILLNASEKYLDLNPEILRFSSFTHLEISPFTGEIVSRNSIVNQKKLILSF